MAQRAYLTMDQGTDFSAEVELSSYFNNIYYNLTDHVVTSMMKKSWQSDYFYEFDTEVIDALGGKIVISMPYERTSIIEPGRYLYDIVLTNLNSGQKYRAVEGIITVTPGITL